MTRASSRAIGIVTAAGRGGRAGAPKALFRDESGRALAALHAQALLDGGADLVLVAVRADVAPLLGGALPAGAVLVVSSEPDEDGPAGSIRAAVASLHRRQAAGASAGNVAVVTPVDKRPAEPSLVEALIAAIRSGGEAAKAVCAGRGGHPVAIRWELLTALRSGTTLRELLARCRDVAEIEATATALDDLDDAASMQTAGLTPPPPFAPS